MASLVCLFEEYVKAALGPDKICCFQGPSEPLTWLFLSRRKCKALPSPRHGKKGWHFLPQPQRNFTQGKWWPVEKPTSQSWEPHTDGICVPKDHRTEELMTLEVSNSVLGSTLGQYQVAQGFVLGSFRYLSKPFWIPGPGLHWTQRKYHFFVCF